MTKISLTLKSVNPEDRKAKLLEHIKKINGIIESHRKKYLIDKKIEILDNFHGIMIPFSHIGHNSPFNSNLVRKKGKALISLYFMHYFRLLKSLNQISSHLIQRSEFLIKFLLKQLSKTEFLC